MAGLPRRQIEFTLDIMDDYDTMFSEYIIFLDRLRQETCRAYPLFGCCYPLKDGHQIDSPDRFISINVNIPEASVLTIIMDGNDLYIRGFALGTTCFLFNLEDTDKYMKEHISAGYAHVHEIGFGGEYSGGNGLHTRRVDFDLGLYLLHESLIILIQRNEEHYKRALLRVIQMFAEALRFLYLMNKLRENEVYTLTDVDVTLQNSWASNSEIIYLAWKEGNDDQFRGVLKHSSDISDIRVLKYCREFMDDHLLNQEVDTIIVCGLHESGKTHFFNMLKFGQCNARLEPSVHIDMDIFEIFCMPQKGKPIRVLDFPSNMVGLNEYLPQAFALVFTVNAVTFHQNSDEVIRCIFDIMSQFQKKTPLLIYCNRLEGAVLTCHHIRRIIMKGLSTLFGAKKDFIVRLTCEELSVAGKFFTYYLNN